jgi:transcription-repair coupling factor (superfamily II helicase)
MIDRFGLLPEPVKTLHQVTELKLSAAKLGIKKIDYGQEGGRILFIEQPDIDPMKIIKLIQSQSSTYKLDGNDKLRLLKPIIDVEFRIKALEELFEYLS